MPNYPKVQNVSTGKLGPADITWDPWLDLAGGVRIKADKFSVVIKDSAGTVIVPEFQIADTLVCIADLTPSTPFKEKEKYLFGITARLDDGDGEYSETEISFDDLSELAAAPNLSAVGGTAPSIPLGAAVIPTVVLPTATAPALPPGAPAAPVTTGGAAANAAGAPAARVTRTVARITQAPGVTVPPAATAIPPGAPATAASAVPAAVPVVPALVLPGASAAAPAAVPPGAPAAPAVVPAAVVPAAPAAAPAPARRGWRSWNGLLIVAIVAIVTVGLGIVGITLGTGGIVAMFLATPKGSASGDSNIAHMAIMDELHRVHQAQERQEIEDRLRNLPRNFTPRLPPADGQFQPATNQPSASAGPTHQWDGYAPAYTPAYVIAPQQVVVSTPVYYPAVVPGIGVYAAPYFGGTYDYRTPRYHVDENHWNNGCNDGHRGGQGGSGGRHH